MQFYAMDPVLIEINKIKNLEMIKFYYILDSIPSISIIYDNGKILNLCSRDKFFIELVRKVKDVYNEEKDKQILKPFGGSTLDVDDLTKNMLENGNIENINNIYDGYTDKCAYDQTLLLQKDKIMPILTILEYHLKDFLSKTDMNVSFSNKLIGYRNNYTIEGTLNGNPKIFKIRVIQEDENNYTFKVGGILNLGNEIDVNVSFKKDKIVIYLDIDNYNFSGTYEYYFDKDKLISSIHISDNDTLKCYKKSELPKAKNGFYLLPWNALYGLNAKNDNDIVEQHLIYLDETDNYSLCKENYFKSYFKNGNKYAEIILDAMKKDTFCIPLEDLENVYLIETLFSNTRGTNGYYKEFLSDNYFYNLARANDIKSIKQDDMIPIDKDMVLSRSDFSNKDNMLKLVRG